MAILFDKNIALSYRARLPIHASAALILLTLTCILAHVTLNASRSKHFAFLAAERRLITEKAALQQKPTAISSGNFTRGLLDLKQTDAVIAHINNRAVAVNLRIASIAIQHQPATQSTWGIVKINLATSSDYQAIKSLIQDVLDRYSAISVQTLSLRSLQNSFGQLDTQLEFAVYLKD